jgi:hypothetical protein
MFRPRTHDQEDVPPFLLFPEKRPHRRRSQTCVSRRRIIGRPTDVRSVSGSTSGSGTRPQWRPLFRRQHEHESMERVASTVINLYELARAHETPLWYA